MVAGHKVFKAEMKVTYPHDGIARFLVVNSAGEATAPELVKTSKEFKNAHFKKFARGQRVIATFRVSEQNRRYLLNVRSMDAERTPDEETFEPSPKIMDPIDIVSDGFYYPPDVQRVFSIADKIAKEDGMTTLLMVGPSGYGKTMFPTRFANKTGRACVRINCAAIRDPEEWMGFREAKEGSTLFEPSEFAIALEKGNTVIILDEVNRLEPWLHNTLFPLLDDDRATVVHNRKFEVAKDTVFVMTINQGLEFTGTFELDQAFLNRVYATVRVGPPPDKIEIEILKQRVGITHSDAVSIIKTAGLIRKTAERGESDVDCSTRAVLRIALLSKYGMSLRAAFHDVIEAAAFDTEIRKKLTDIINSNLGMFSSAERETKRSESVFFNGE